MPCCLEDRNQCFGGTAASNAGKWEVGTVIRDPCLSSLVFCTADGERGLLRHMVPNLETTWALIVIYAEDN
jgi:hypothetical protein